MGCDMNEGQTLHYSFIDRYDTVFIGAQGAWYARAKMEAASLDRWNELLALAKDSTAMIRFVNPDSLAPYCGFEEVTLIPEWTRCLWEAGSMIRFWGSLALQCRRYINMREGGYPNITAMLDDTEGEWVVLSVSCHVTKQKTESEKRIPGHGGTVGL